MTKTLSEFSDEYLIEVYKNNTVENACSILNTGTMQLYQRLHPLFKSGYIKRKNFYTVMLEKSNKPLDVIESPENRITNDMRKRIAESQYIPEFKTDYVWDKNYCDEFKTYKNKIVTNKLITLPYSYKEDLPQQTRNVMSNFK
jgi:hypothetical protein